MNRPYRISPSSLIFAVISLVSVTAGCYKAPTPKSELAKAHQLHSAPDSKLNLWTNDGKSTGVGWVSPIADGLSIKTLREGDEQIIQWHAKQDQKFVECGWQWALWYPAFQGTDITGYDGLQITLRLSGPAYPRDLMLSLASPGDHCDTLRVPLKTRYVSDLADGKWHVIFVPFIDLYTPDMKFDRKHAIQVILGTWNGNGGDFTASICGLGFISNGAKKRLINGD